MIFRASKGTVLVTFFDFVKVDINIITKFTSKTERKIFTIFLLNRQDDDIKLDFGYIKICWVSIS